MSSMLIVIQLLQDLFIVKRNCSFELGCNLANPVIVLDNVTAGVLRNVMISLACCIYQVFIVNESEYFSTMVFPLDKKVNLNIWPPP